MENEKKFLSFKEMTVLSFFSVFILGYVVFGNVMPGFGEQKNRARDLLASDDALAQAVLPAEGIVLPVRWNDLGAQMVEKGVIDFEKLDALYEKRGGFSSEERALLLSRDNGPIVMNKDNAGFLLNLFWALGLSAKNDILEKGPMGEYEDPGNFASTGGWIIARGGAMEHYSKYPFITLTPQAQAAVERVAKNIYRPCCDNPTYFPDCNHGMAMLGLLELMASQGVSEETMYKVALQVNSYWFPETYITIAKYFALKGISWKDVDPKEVLSAEYSSGSGFQKISDYINSSKGSSGSACGV